MKISKKIFTRIIQILAFGSLAIAYISGFLIQENLIKNELETGFPEYILEKIGTTSELYTVFDRSLVDEQGYIRVTDGMGWGGPFKTAIFINSQHQIRKIFVISHKETPTFFDFITKNGFFEQFENKAVSDTLLIDEDVDAISSATISSQGFAKAIRKTAHKVGREQFNLTIQERNAEWVIGNNEFILIIFYAIAITAALRKYNKARYILMAFGLGFLGFWINRPISISNIAAVSLGFLPDFMEQLLWYILVPGTLIVTLFLGKNVYCYWMCPFGSMQEFITLIGGVKIQISRGMVKYFKYTVYLLLWLSLMITFITNNPALAAFEPFAVLFSLNGLGIQWYLVSVAIIGSFLIPRFWCRFFCPVGAVLQYITKLSRRIMRRLKKASVENRVGVR